MSDDRAFYSTVKVHREWYLAEYATPLPDAPFATLSLTALEARDAATVASAMEAEIDHWISRYPVPIMMSAFDDTGSLLRLTPARSSDHLIAWPAPDSKVTVRHWRIVPSKDFPTVDLRPAELRRIYHDIPFRMRSELAKGAKAHERTVRAGTVLVFLVFVVLPVTWLLIEFNAPQWLSWIVLLYGLSQIYIKALKFSGHWPQSEADAKRSADEAAMRHHHYHCQRNPEGFRRIVAENCDREARTKTHQEAERLKRRGHEAAASDQV